MSQWSIVWFIREWISTFSGVPFFLHSLRKPLKSLIQTAITGIDKRQISINFFFFYLYLRLVVHAFINVCYQRNDTAINHDYIWIGLIVILLIFFGSIWFFQFQPYGIKHGLGKTNSGISSDIYVYVAIQWRT